MAEHLTLAVGERVGFRPGLGGQLGVDHTLAGANAADGVGQRGGGGVLKRPAVVLGEVYQFCDTRE